MHVLESPAVSPLAAKGYEHESVYVVHVVHVVPHRSEWGRQEKIGVGIEPMTSEQEKFGFWV